MYFQNLLNVRLSWTPGRYANLFAWSCLIALRLTPNKRFCLPSTHVIVLEDNVVSPQSLRTEGGLTEAIRM
jgi:hypothetical protein